MQCSSLPATPAEGYHPAVFLHRWRGRAGCLAVKARAISRAMSRLGTAARLPLNEPPQRPTFARERAAMRRGMMPVAGCDEAGRGPPAGPGVAAAGILDPKRVPGGLDDSKRLPPERREALYERICASAQVAIAFAPPARIDCHNIRQASLWALARAVAALPTKPGLVYVDGCDRIAV